MRALKANIKSLSKLLNTWQVLFSFWETESDLVATEIRTTDAKKHFSAVSLDFAISQVLMVRGRLLAYCRALQKQWPSKHNELFCIYALQGTDLKLIFPKEIYAGLIAGDADLSNFVTAEYYRSNEMMFESSSDIGADEKLSLIFEYREAMLRMFALEEAFINLNDLGNMRKALISHFGQLCEKFDWSEKTLSWHFRRYVLNDQFSPWLLYDTGEEEVYQSFFRAIQPKDIALRDISVEVAGYLFSNVLNRQVRDKAELIIRRLSQSIFDVDYPDFVHAVTQGGGQWGSQSGIGIEHRINIIPSSLFLSSSPITLGFISGTDKRKGSYFERVLGKLRTQLENEIGQPELLILFSDRISTELFARLEEIQNRLDYKLPIAVFIVENRNLTLVS